MILECVRMDANLQELYLHFPDYNLFLSKTLFELLLIFVPPLAV
jgi:hypothetical protein